VLPCKRTFPRDGFIKHDAKRKKIASVVRFAPHNLLRRHVRGGAAGDQRSAFAGLCRELREAEIDNFGFTTGRNDNVRGFDIAMNDV